MSENTEMYNFYLFSQLWHNEHSEHINTEYDTTFELIHNKYLEYIYSEYSMDTKPGYECMLSFLEAQNELV